MIGNDAIFAANKVKQLSIIYIIMAVLNLLGAMVLSPLMGATGICFSVFIAYMVRTIGMDFIFYKEMNLDVLHFFKETFVRLSIPLIICLIAGIVLNYLILISGWLGFFVKGVLFCMCYALVIYFLAMNDYEKSLILAPIKKL